MPEVLDEQLPKHVARKDDRLLVIARGSVLSRRHVELGNAPCRCGKPGDLCKQRRGATPEHDEQDAYRIDPCKSLIGGELRVEYEVGGWFPVGLFPKVDKAEYLLHFFPLAEIDVEIAESLRRGVLGEEYKDARLPRTPHRDVVLLDYQIFPVIRRGMKVQIKGLPLEDPFARHLRMPGRKEPHCLRVIDLARVLRQEALLRYDVQAGE